MSRMYPGSVELQGLRPRLLRALRSLSRIVVPKSLYPIHDGLQQAPRRAHRVNVLAAWVILGFFVLPFVIEALSLWVAQWFQVMDKRLVVRTPLLDFSSAKIADCWQEFGSWAAYHFEEASWSPHSILPIVVVLLFVAARMLKK
jgi:hypothetical protein